MVDLQTLLAPVAADDPCGPDLSDDPALLMLEQLAAGVAEQRMGWSVRPARPPDWAAVAERASAWLVRSKDWRVALLLVRAWLHLERWQGLERGVALLAELWSRHGGAVHPRPDADNPVGWWSNDGGEDTGNGPRLAVDPLLADLGAMGLGSGADMLTVAELERLQQQRLLDMPRAFDATRAQRALGAELAAAPALEATLAAMLDRLDGLVDAIGAQASARAPHALLARLRLRLGRVSDALRARHALAEERKATPPPDADEPKSPLPLYERCPPGMPIPPLPIERLAGALSSEAPCGPDLEYDPAHLTLLQLAAWTPERQYGDFVEPARPPDWPKVYGQALELFRRTRDLRIAAVLACAAAATNGWRGAAEGLQLVVALVERWWHAVHPILDAEDNDDAYMRVNALAALAAPDGLLGELRRIGFGDGAWVVVAGDIERVLASGMPTSTLPRGVRSQLQHAVQRQLEREPGLVDQLREMQASVDRLRAVVLGRTTLEDPLVPLEHFLSTLLRVIDEVGVGQWSADADDGPLPAVPAPAATSPPSAQTEAPEALDVLRKLERPDAMERASAPTITATRDLIARIEAWLEAVPR